MFLLEHEKSKKDATKAKEMPQSMLATTLHEFIRKFFHDFDISAPNRNAPLLRDETCGGQGLRLDSIFTFKSYVQFIAIAGIVAKLERENRNISQRDMYYTIKFLFSSQVECNKMIITVGKVLQLKRFQMRIEAGSRGSVAGDLRFRVTRNDGARIPWTECWALTDHGGLPISQVWISNDEEAIEMESDALFLFVVEKEGVFRRLCDDKFHEKFRCILVTGCGYPDIGKASNPVAAPPALHRQTSTKFDI